MSVWLFLQAAPLAILFAICTAAVLHPSFHDNLFQRIGLGVTATGAVLQIATLVERHASNAPSTMIIYGAAIYAMGTLHKVLRHKQRSRRDEPRHS